MKESILEALAGRSEETIYLPDLTLWYAWHSARGTIPDAWRADSLPAVCGKMGVPVWQPVRPWRLETPGVNVIRAEGPEERVVRWETPRGTLQSRWVLGPDEDWWQAEYPVKSAADLDAAAALIGSFTYVLEGDRLARGIEEVGGSGVVAATLPMQPYPDLLHNFLGWQEGFMLTFEVPDRISDLLAVLEEKHRRLAEAVVQLPAAVVFSPDNLDGQFIPPSLFEQHLESGYRATAERVHEAGRFLAVHVGGMGRGLLAGLSGAGVDLIEGICGAPQSDAPLAEARRLCGPGVTLWGGLPQDLLMSSHPEADFRAAAAAAFEEARRDGRVLLGAADRVPVQALPERLAMLARLGSNRTA